MPPSEREGARLKDRNWLIIEANFHDEISLFTPVRRLSRAVRRSTFVLIQLSLSPSLSLPLSSRSLGFPKNEEIPLAIDSSAAEITRDVIHRRIVKLTRKGPFGRLYRSSDTAVSLFRSFSLSPSVYHRVPSLRACVPYVCSMCECVRTYIKRTKKNRSVRERRDMKNRAPCSEMKPTILCSLSLFFALSPSENSKLAIAKSLWNEKNKRKKRSRLPLPTPLLTRVQVCVCKRDRLARAL